MCAAEVGVGHVDLFCLQPEHAMLFTDSDGRVFMAINRDGTVTSGIEGASEAGRVFVESIRKELATILHQPHTPTDDEREALLSALREEGFSGSGEEIGTHETVIFVEHVPDIVLALGFRRSEVPEPSADEKIEWPDHWTMNEKLRDLHARWHDQKGNLLGREACGYERCEFWDSAQYTLRLADVPIAGRDPQGEPSDAQVRAAALAMYQRQNSLSMSGASTLARAALIAAGGVR